MTRMTTMTTTEVELINACAHVEAHYGHPAIVDDPPAFDAQIPKIAPVKPETLNAAFCSSRALYAEVVAAAVQAT